MGCEIKDARVNTGTLVARETGFQPGRNGNFDLSLFRKKDGDYIAEIYMKVQFFFVDGDEDLKGWSKINTCEWKSSETELFMRTWHKMVRNTWATSYAGTLSDLHDLSVCVNFHLQEGGWMWDHFEVDVVKLPPGKFGQSYVDRAVFSADVQLDSNDIVPKASGQIAATHEFGHMIGLPDEYHASSANNADGASLMHGGTSRRARHFDHIISWCNRKIKK